MNTQRISVPLAAALAALAFAAPAAETPAPAPVKDVSAPAPAEAPAAPAPEFRYPAPPPAKRVPIPKASPEALSRVMPRGPKFDKLPPDEKEHIRRMAEFRIARDDAEKELLELDKAVEARRAAILAENEDAKKLTERIEALRAEYAAATNELAAIFRADEKLAELDSKIQPARLLVENSQYSLNQEVAAAMHKRMAAMRKAYEEANPPPEPVPEEEKPAEGEGGEEPEKAPDAIDPEDAPPGTVPGVSPDIKPPLDPAKRIAPLPKPSAAK